MSTLYDRFIKTLRPHLSLLDPADEVPPDVPLPDLGLDSLAVIELVLDLEEEFATAFPDDMLRASLFQNAASLHKALTELLGAHEALAHPASQTGGTLT